jgi:ketosteroid isomerase-like protein
VARRLRRRAQMPILAGMEIAVPFPKPFFMSSTTTTMTTVDVANRLVELCRQGQFETAQKELFADDAVSIEPHGTSDFEKETKGLEAILEKGKKWGEMVEEAHGMDVSEPLLADSSFAVTMMMDVTMKGGQRMKMTELCIYHVKDGKIVSEQFLM